MINNQADLWSPDRFTGFPVGLAGPVGPYTSPLIRLVHKSRGVMDGFDTWKVRIVSTGLTAL